jgi:hypothetical protein
MYRKNDARGAPSESLYSCERWVRSSCLALEFQSRALSSQRAASAVRPARRAFSARSNHRRTFPIAVARSTSSSRRRFISRDPLILLSGADGPANAVLNHYTPELVARARSHPALNNSVLGSERRRSMRRTAKRTMRELAALVSLPFGRHVTSAASGQKRTS